MREKFFSLVKGAFIDSLDSDFIIIVGMMPSRESGLLKDLHSGKNIVYMSVIEDKAMNSIVKIQSRYEAGSEEGVLSILAKELLEDKDIDEKTKEFFENLDDGYISAETNVGEEELEDINELYKNSEKPLLILGADLYAHPRAKNIAKIINLFIEFGNFKIYDKNRGEDVKQNLDQDDLEDVAELESFDGSVVYTCSSTNRDEEELLIGSTQFMMAAKLKDEDEIFVITQNAEHERKFILDRELKGTVALLPSAEGDESYNYKIAKIIKRES